MKLPSALLFFTECVALALGSSDGPTTSTPYVWRLPKGFPKPAVPPDNPMTLEKVYLGRHLFHDKRLSGNGKQSCASCHRQERSFADDKPVSAEVDRRAGNT
jgi:cytochrome c peroxidase